MDNGFISLHRKIRGHPFWQDKPFTKAQAWIDMLMMANHKGNTIMLGNEIIKLERGQFIRTERSLGEAWGWGRTKVRSFVKLCENQTMITTQIKPKGNQVTILNYNDYQRNKTKLKPNSNQNRTTSEPRPNQEKECSNNIKKQFKEFVFLSSIEYERLCVKYGQKIIDSKIEDLDNYIGIDPEKRIEKYKDHNRVILSWLKKGDIKPIELRSNVCPECNKNPISANGLCKECNARTIG